MEMSVTLPTKYNSWEVVARAEELGFSRAWFYDTPLVNAELFASMAVAAVKTSRIELYTGVMIPSNRISPTAASGLATLNALAPGRIGFGVSTGFTGRRTMGLKPVTLARMTDYIDEVQGLLAGKIVDFRTEGGGNKISFLNPDVGLINIEDSIPLAISALGPKGRALTARYGGQWITGSTFPEREKQEIEEMKTLWQESGRDLDDFFPILSVGGRVLDDGEPADSELSRAQAWCYASVLFHATVEAADFGDLQPGSFPCQKELDEYRAVYDTYEPSDAKYIRNHRGHMMFVRPEETHLTAEAVKMFTLMGTKQELVERLKGVKAMGYKQIQFHTVPGHEHDMMARWAGVMSEVNG